jgi:class 3 adenylate cyclase
MELARNDPEKMVRFKKLTTFFRGRLLVSAFIAGALLGLPSSFTISPHLANIHLLQPESLPSVVGVTFSACVGLLSLAAVGWLAYLAPNIVTALFVGFLYAFGQIGTHLLLGPQARDVHSVILRFYLIYSAISPLVALLAGVGAAIQTRTLEELNIQRNDEASLIAEQLKIQWRLAEHSCSVTVVVVDVVKSTLMKEGEPGLQVEYSFRKFQQWIEEIALSHSGTVTSTAGDGAVFSFTSCHNAMIAAAEIQRKMPAFNQTWNRLATRFRVRIGLHMGEVQGDINKVQFAQVIDVAAHVQKVAPAGGVAVTAEVVATLGPSAFVPLAVKSDGHDVFLALNPSGL